MLVYLLLAKSCILFFKICYLIKPSYQESRYYYSHFTYEKIEARKIMCYSPFIELVIMVYRLKFGST